MTGRQFFQDFLNGEIPAEERERMNQEHSLCLELGATFFDALASQAVRLAKNSPEWARLCRRYGFTEGAGSE